MRHGAIYLRVSPTAPFIVKRAAVTHTRQHEPVRDVQRLLLIQSKPSDCADRARDEEKAIALPALPDEQMSGEEDGDADPGQIVVAQGGVTDVTRHQHFLVT